MSIKFTLKKLKRAKNKGVTVNDFPVGYRLSARILNLRNAGYEISMIKELNYSVGFNRLIGRYKLIERK